MHFALPKKSIWGFPVSSKRVNSFRVLKKSTPLGGTRVALVSVISISWYLMLIVTPMHFSCSNSLHYLNQDKHPEKCIGVSAEHASAGTRVLSASTRVMKQLRLFQWLDYLDGFSLNIIDIDWYLLIFIDIQFYWCTTIIMNIISS